MSREEALRRNREAIAKAQYRAGIEDEGYSSLEAPTEEIASEEAPAIASEEVPEEAQHEEAAEVEAEKEKKE